jgi:hypothetical protein
LTFEIVPASSLCQQVVLIGEINIPASVSSERLLGLRWPGHIWDYRGYGEDFMKVEAGKVYRFTKSGNLVRTISETDYGGRGSWHVARVDSGKEMIVHGRALVEKDHPDWS